MVAVSGSASKFGSLAPEKFVDRAERSRRRDEIFKHRGHCNAGNNSWQIENNAESRSSGQPAEHKITDNERKHHDYEDVIAKIEQCIFQPHRYIAADRRNLVEKIFKVIQRPFAYFGLECQENGIEVNIQPKNKPMHDREQKALR